MKTKLIFSVLLAFFLSACINENKTGTNLEKIVKDVNKKCPQMIDSETRFDGMEFIHPNTLLYKYSLVNLNRLNVDTAEFRKALWPGILGTIRVSPEMQTLRDNRTTLLYEYHDKASQFIYRFTIRPEHYQDID